MRGFDFRKCCVLVMLGVGITACTNSGWLLSNIYDRMDNILARETKEYADFTPEQVREINLLADQYHLWHRTHQLPAYAKVLREVHAKLAAGEPVVLADVEDWAARLEFLVREMGTCHPLNSAITFLQNLSDEQVEQILAHGIKEHEEFLEDHIDMPVDEYIAKRFKTTKKWFGRFGLSLNKQHQGHLRATIVVEETLDPNLLMTWHLAFVELLRQREAADFASKMSSHLSLLWTLQDDHFPETVAFNQALWNQYFADLALSQTPEQRAKFSAWAKKMSGNLQMISENVSVKKIEKLKREGVIQTCEIAYPASETSPEANITH